MIYQHINVLLKLNKVSQVKQNTWCQHSTLPICTAHWLSMKRYYVHRLETVRTELQSVITEIMNARIRLAALAWY